MFFGSLYFLPEKALLFAVVGNHLDIVEWLLKEEHVDANVSNNLGMTALMCAAANNYYECIKLLLEHSADISKKNKLMKTALDLATGQVTIQKHFVDLISSHEIY